MSDRHARLMRKRIALRWLRVEARRPGGTGWTEAREAKQWRLIHEIALLRVAIWVGRKW